MPEPVKCSKCARPFNATFRRCPFCNAAVGTPGSASPSLAPSRGPGRDYAAIAEQTIAAGRPLLALEFHPAAIAALDAFFENTWGAEGLAPTDPDWQPSAGQRAVIVNFGAFFGELLCRQFGGRWQDDPANLFASRVVLPGEVHAFPLSKVFKRLKNGAADSVEPLYLLVREKLGAGPSATEADGWVRQARHFEGVGRPDLAALFYERALALRPDLAGSAALEKLRAQAAAQLQRDEDETRTRALSEARAKLAELVERGRSTLAARGVRVDHGALTLTGLDVFMNETFGLEPLADEARRKHAALELALGAYVGELLHVCWKAAWQEQPDVAVEQWSVAWPSGLTALPFAVTTNRMAEGARRPVLEQVAGLLKAPIAKGDTEDPPEVPSDWLAQADDYARLGRLDLAVRFGNLALGFGGDAAAPRVKLARWCYALGRLREAAAHLEKARGLEPGPERVEEHLVRAATLVGQAQHAAALAAFERALELDPGSAHGLLGKARALLALQRAGEAGHWLEAFAGRGDCEPERTFLAARAADQSGELAKASELFARVQDSRQLPAESCAHAKARLSQLAKEPSVMVAAAERVADLGQAVAAYARVSALHPTLPEPWRERGVGLAMLGQFDEALQCLDHAAALEPGEPKSYDHKAVVLARQQRLDAALEALEQGLRHCPGSAQLLNRKGTLLGSSGRTDEALRAYEAAIRAEPEHAETWAFKGDLEHRLGRTEQAGLSLQRFLEAKSGSREPRVEAVRRLLWKLQNPGQPLDRERAEQCQARALEREKTGDSAAALPLFDEAVAADPLFGDAWLNRGLLLLKLSRYREALASCSKAEELLGPSSLLAHGLASCLSQLGRGAEAVGCYDRLLARGATSPEALRGKARTLLQVGRPAEALPLYQQLVARSPADVPLLKERAEALQAGGHHVEAVAAYDAALAVAPGDRDLLAARTQAASRLRA